MSRTLEVEHLKLVPVGEGIERLIVHIGFMDKPHVPAAIQLAVERGLLPDVGPEEITYFVGRQTVIPTKERPGMALWRDGRGPAQLWVVFIKEDALLVEVNPLVKTDDGKIIALDGKVSLDENAAFRQPEHEALEDKAAANPLEAAAKAKGLNYVKLDGEVGIIGNGAGLVMSTLDVVAYAGENHGNVKPANFLDIGGGASAEVMANGLEIILGDPDVKSVFVNVFGGITACDAVANGIVQALELLKSKGEDVTKPLVVRLDGNNAELGRRILADAEPPARSAGGHHGRRGRACRRAGCEVRDEVTRTMAIFLTKESKVIVQGMTGSEGQKHTRRMLASGTNIVGGVNPRKAGTTVDFDGAEVPVFGSVEEAIDATGADVTVIFVPAKFTKGAVIEAIDAEIPLAVVITEGIAGPRLRQLLGLRGQEGNKTRIIGPNCPGLITPGQSNAGIIPADITKPGRIGLVSKSGTLTYQMMYELRDIGFSSSVGIGGDPVIGTTHIDALARLRGRPRHRRDRDDRRDRRRRRGAGRGLHQGQRHQAGRRLRGGLHRPRGQDDGPRGRHRLRLLRHRSGEEGGPRGRGREGRQDPVGDRAPGARRPGRLTPPRLDATGPHHPGVVRARAVPGRRRPGGGIGKPPIHPTAI